MDIEKLHYALDRGLDLENAIREISQIDFSNIKCCHDILDEGECGCYDRCWETLAALLCKYNLHDVLEEVEVPIETHREYQQREKTISQTDLSFTSTLSYKEQESDCGGSDCEKHSNDFDHYHDQNHDMQAEGHKNHHHDHQSIDPSHEEPVISDALNYLFSREPHTFVTQHHHHYRVKCARGSCAFHKEFAMQMYYRNRARCACALITTIISIVLNAKNTKNTKIGHLCCGTIEEGSFAARECCLEEHSLLNEQPKSLEKYSPIIIAPGKAIRHLSLGVSGMTCTGCENKLSKALKAIEGVIEQGPKGVKTNFMQGRADIWYNEMLIKNPKEEICDYVEKRTGFTCGILSDSDRSEKGRFSNCIRFGVDLPEKNDRNTLLVYIENLKGVDRVSEFDITKPEEPSPFQQVLGHILFWRLSNPPDLESGTAIPDSRKVVDVRYDPQLIHARDIPQHIRGISQPSPVVELVDMEEPEKCVAKQVRRDLQKLLWQTVLATILTIPILIITWTPSIKDQIPATNEMKMARLATYIALNVVCFILATIVQVCGYDIYLNAYRSIVFQHILDMDCLIVLSTTAAYIYSCVYFGLNVQREGQKLQTGKLPSDSERERHEPIFEASALLITLILAGRLLTGCIKNWATSRVSVGNLQKKACRRSEQTTFAAIKNRKWITEDIRLLHYGDVLLAEAGESIVTDGIVINHEATVDQSHLTGEANPIHVGKNNQVMAGSRVIDGKIEYRVTRLMAENTISSMKQLVNTVSDCRPRMQDYADKVASWLTPGILILALLVCAAWLAYYRTVKSDTVDLKSAMSKAITIAITILAISCPCAIALAVPTVLIFSTQVGVKNGIVIKSPSALERAAKIRYFVADKTGTLTTGKLQVRSGKYWVNRKWEEDSTDAEVQAIQLLIYKLIARDRHPVAKAVLEKLKEKHLKEYTLSDSDKKVQSIVGKGIEGVIEGRLLRGGKPSWVFERSRLRDSSDVRPIFKDSNSTPFVVLDVESDTLLAAFSLQDTIRPEAASVIAKLRDQGIECFMLSGDQAAVCKKVAHEIGIPKENVYAGCSPEEKARHIQLLQYKAAAECEMFKLRGSWFCRKFRAFRSPRSNVLFLGDGTNDAAALTRADVGLTMSNCTDIAAGCSDAGILSSSLTGVLALLALSKRAARLIKLNFTWALKYNFGAVLVSTGLIKWTLPPQYAGVGEAVSVAPIFIIASAMFWRKLRY